MDEGGRGRRVLTRVKTSGGRTPAPPEPREASTSSSLRLAASTASSSSSLRALAADMMALARPSAACSLADALSIIMSARPLRIALLRDDILFVLEPLSTSLPTFPSPPPSPTPAPLSSLAMMVRLRAWRLRPGVSAGALEAFTDPAELGRGTSVSTGEGDEEVLGG